MNYLIISFVGSLSLVLLIYLIYKIYCRFTRKDYIPINNDWIVVRV